MGIGANFALKNYVKNSKAYTKVAGDLTKAQGLNVALAIENDSLTLSTLNSDNKANGLQSKNNQLQSKLDTLIKYNKVCYQRVLEFKGVLRRKSWVFVEIPCSKVE